MNSLIAAVLAALALRGTAKPEPSNDAIARMEQVVDSLNRDRKSLLKAIIEANETPIEDDFKRIFD